MSPDGTSVYVANINSDNVSQYDVGAGGALTPKSTATVAAGDQPFGIAVNGCTITGTAAAERLKGTNGADVICGLDGNDRINGRGGNDALYGDLGDDQLIGEGGSDLLGGGAGFDTANYNPGADQGVAVDLASRTVADDGLGFAESITAVERVEGAKNETEQPHRRRWGEHLIGGLEADTLTGLGGADLLRGEPERAGAGANDTLDGGDDPDQLFPGLGSNTIDGGRARTRSPTAPSAPPTGSTPTP